MRRHVRSDSPLPLSRSDIQLQSYMQPVVLPLLPFFTAGTTYGWRIAQVARLAYALADLFSCRRMPADEGAWDGGRPQTKLWVWLEPTDGWVGPGCELPAEPSLTGCRVEFVNIMVQCVYNNLSYLISLGSAP